MLPKGDWIVIAFWVALPFSSFDLQHSNQLYHPRTETLTVLGFQISLVELLARLSLAIREAQRATNPFEVHHVRCIEERSEAVPERRLGDGQE